MSTRPTEEDRLCTLASYGILDTAPEERFDRITRHAAWSFDVPICLVTLVDEHRQWFKSHHGLEVRETPREGSFCADTILSDDVFAIEDASLDARFSSSPLVVGQPGVRFYAGAPLKTPGGSRLGALCLMDTKPRSLAPDALGALRTLAGIVEEELERSRRALEATGEAERVRKLESRFHHMVQNGSEVITLLAGDGAVQYQSPSITRILGYAPEALVGRNVFELIHPEDAGAVRDAFTRVIESGESAGIAFRFLSQDGTWTWMESTATNLLEDAAVRGVVVNSRDISDRKRQEARQAAEQHILEQIARRAPLSEVLDAICLLVEGQIEGLCSVLLLDETRLRHGAAPSLPSAYCKAIDGIGIGLDVGTRGTVAFCKETVFTTDIAIDPSWQRYKDVALQHGLRACFSTPILARDGRPLGTFAIYYRAPQEPHEEHRWLVQTATYLAGIALESHRSERAIRESEESFRALTEATSQIVWRVYPDGSDYITGEQWISHTGQAPEEAAGGGWTRMIHPDDQERIAAAWQMQLDTQSEAAAEFRIMGRNGAYRWFSGRTIPVFDEQGRLREFIGAAMDIHDRRLAEDALRESEMRARRLAAVADRTTNAVIISDTDNRIEWINEGFTRLYGFTLEEVVGKRPAAVLHGPETDPEMQRQIQAWLTARKSVAVEIANYHKDGRRLWVNLDIQPLTGLDGEPDGFTAVATDITAQKEVEAALRESEERYRIIVQHTGQLIYDSDVASGRIQWSGAIAETTGYSPETYRAFGIEAWMEHVHPDDRAEVLVQLRQAQRTGRDFSVGYRFRDTHGNYRYIEDVGMYLATEDGCPHRVLGVMRDVTERRQAEENLEQSRRRFQRLVNGIDGIVWEGTINTCTGEVTFTFVSEKLREVLGYDPADWLEDSQRWADAILEEERTWAVSACVEATGAGRDHTLEYRVVTAAGRTVWLRDIVSVLAEHDGVVTSAGIMIDVTDRKSYECGLIEAKEKAEEMTRLKNAFLTNMSHEIRTPLTSIIGFSSVLSEEIDGEMRELAQMIYKSGERLNETLHAVMDLAQLESGSLQMQPGRLELGALARETVENFRREAHEKGLSLEYSGGLEAVWAELDRSATVRILNNLLSNAVKFTCRGSVTVSVGQDEQHVWVGVRDTGVGISAEFMPHLFDEFKQESSGLSRNYEGSGLGLAITKRLVELMNGTIEVESTKGEGSVFTVRLPALLSESAAA